jgi:hypothetical protein
LNRCRRLAKDWENLNRSALAFLKLASVRLDDPNAGWKGRGLWTSSGDRVPWLQEGGKGMKPMAVHFQLRPDPLAH